MTVFYSNDNDDDRVIPTREDQLIFKRNLDRLLAWGIDLGPIELVHAVHNWCGDYQERKESGKSKIA